MSKVKLAFERRYSSVETKCLTLYQVTDGRNKFTINYFDKTSDVPKDHIPVGHVDWVVDFLGHVPRPECYPDFMKDYFHRDIWFSNKWPSTKNIFIKPGDKPKRFEAIATNDILFLEQPEPPFWCSEVVNFINEWRYYVIDGEIVFVEWYKGNDEDLEIPKWDTSIIPKNYCGAIDMGTLDNNKLALVECGEPYSIGWYGSYMEGNIYFEFITKGWQYLINRKY